MKLQLSPSQQEALAEVRRKLPELRVVLMSDPDGGAFGQLLRPLPPRKFRPSESKNAKRLARRDNPY